MEPRGRASSVVVGLLSSVVGSPGRPHPVVTLGRGHALSARERIDAGRCPSGGLLPIRLPIYGLAEAGTVRHHPDGLLTFAQVKHHDTSSDNTGRTVLLTLSRCRDGFESCWGSENSRPALLECLFWFPAPVADLVPIYVEEADGYEGLCAAAGRRRELWVSWSGPVSG